MKITDLGPTGTFRPSTYGVITGASTFMLVEADDDMRSLLSAGYITEKVVLEACAMGLGTCWVGGTFRNSDFVREPCQGEDTKLKAVVPIGTAAKHKSLLSGIMRIAAGSSHRKPLNRLFFSDNFSTPVSKDDADSMTLSFEMMRLAPSSMNSQPWRGLATGETVHFYAACESNLTPIDMGIGLLHFHEAEKAQGHDGEFHFDSEAPSGARGMKYTVSYRRMR